MTNDFAAKFYTVADSLTRGRTDGGLVRLITPIGDGRRGRGRRPAAALPRRPPRPAGPLRRRTERRSTEADPPPSRPAARADPVVSVLVVSYNTREMTLDCLRSLAAETCGAARGDRARQRLARRLGRGDRRGLPRAPADRERGRTTASRKATTSRRARRAGDYLLLLNPDTVVLDRRGRPAGRLRRRTPGGRHLGRPHARSPTAASTR